MRRWDTAASWYGSYSTRRTANCPRRSFRLCSMVASKFSGFFFEGWKMRCHTIRTFLVSQSKAHATMAVWSCFTDPSRHGVDGQPRVRQQQGRSRIDAGVPPVDLDERRLARDEAVLDHSHEGVGPQLAADLLDPLGGLPRGDRFVVPGHDEPGCPAQAGTDLLAFRPPLVEVLQDGALALEPGVGRRESGQRRDGSEEDHLIPQAARAPRS